MKYFIHGWDIDIHVLIIVVFNENEERMEYFLERMEEGKQVVKRNKLRKGKGKGTGERSTEGKHSAPQL